MQYSGDADQRSGKRKSIGKRKLSDQGEPAQSTITDILSQNKLHLADPTSSKRSRISVSPSLPTTHHSTTMYNFFGSQSHNTAFGQSVPVSNTALQTNSTNSSVRGFSPHVGAKKLIVKNLRVGPRVNHEPYFDKTWAQLDEALMDIFNTRKPQASLEELYKGAENICRQEQAALLAQKLQDRCKEYVSGKLRQSLVSRAGNGNAVDTLLAVLQAWESWHAKLITVRWVFYYLDQSFLLHSKEFPVIHAMGLNLFRSYLFADQSLKPKTLQGVCDLIAADRDPELANASDPSLLRNAIELFHKLDVYNKDFEPLFMALTESYISAWAARENEGPLASYVENSQRLIDREVEQCAIFSLNRSTKQKLSEILDEILIARHENVLLKQDEVVSLLRSGNNSALKKLYGLLSRRSLCLKLKAPFGTFIAEEGKQIVFDDENEADMVSRLLEFKKQLDLILSDCFDGDQELGNTLRESFGSFMNMSKPGKSVDPKTGEMIAKYVDRLLKGGWKMVPGQGAVDEDTEIHRQLDQVLDLFRFVQGKAVFEAFYKIDLARRLLLGRSASEDAEKSMLVRLRKECGSGFTHNLESMFKDMEVARDEMSNYSSILKERGSRHRPIDLHVSVLSAASWPTYPDIPVRIPPDVTSAISDFERFYHSKHTGRKLIWKHQLAHCQLRAQFPSGRKEIMVSSFQAIVLLLFNDVSSEVRLSFAQIQESTGLSDPELKRTLQSLACAKYRVLTKSPKGKDVDTTDEFAYNTLFTDPKMRIKINQIQLKETKEENKVMHERVAADRHLETQAALVRIMKSRKKITHAELVAEVIEATRTRGTLQPADIKLNIERLIDREYIERGDDNTYTYSS